MYAQHLLAARPRSFTIDCPYISYALVINEIYYIESKCRFVVGLLCVVDIPSKEVDYLLPL